MRVGFTLPNLGPAAGPRLIAEAARRAEALGYDTLWVTERLLFPVKPQTPYVGSADGAWPEAFKVALDPLETLTYAAAQTGRVGLGTNVLVLPYYHPLMLARRLTTLDILSGGRLRVGLGLGWAKDEFDAVGASMAERGRRADEFLGVLKAIWTTDPVEFRGAYYQVPRAIIGAKPVQKPHPPIYLAAYTPAGLKRAATLANGWTPVGLPLEAMAQMIPQLREAARAAGRDPATLEVIVRANVHVTPKAITGQRWIFSGSLEQIKEDVGRVRELGGSEVFFDPAFSPDGLAPETYLQTMERLRPLV